MKRSTLAVAAAVPAVLAHFGPRKPGFFWPAIEIPGLPSRTRPAEVAATSTLPTLCQPDVPSATFSAEATCTVTVAADVPSAVASCTAIELSNLAMPANTTLDLTALQNGTSVVFSGTTTFATTVNEDFDPVVITGSYITVSGAPGSVIDGNGQTYWDGQGSNGGGAKPDHFIVIKGTSHATFRNLYVQNWPTHLFYVASNEDITITDLVLNNTAGDAPNALSGGLAAAHNSDGFDIASSNNVVLRDIQVLNQDDCVAVTSGTNMYISNMHCAGGHGLSIGSIGGKVDNVVSNVTFADSVLIGGENGVRIKTNANMTGSVSGVTYRNISMASISAYGLDVQQDYLNGGPTGAPTNGVNVSGLVFEDITGSVLAGAYNYYILCGEGSCADFTFTNVVITGGNTSCNYPTETCLAAA